MKMTFNILIVRPVLCGKKSQTEITDDSPNFALFVFYFIYNFTPFINSCNALMSHGLLFPIPTYNLRYTYFTETWLEQTIFNFILPLHTIIGLAISSF